MMTSPPGGLAPPSTGNPGSAPGYDWQMASIVSQIVVVLVNRVSSDRSVK